MPGRLRVIGTSHGRAARALRPGEDLVLDLAEEHGLDAPAGVAADDFLDVPARRAVDGLAVEVLRAWRSHFDRPLTVDGVCLPAVWELELLAGVVIPALRRLEGLGRAVDRTGAEHVVVEEDSATVDLARAVAGERGVPAAVEESQSARRRDRLRALPSARDVRRRAIRAATALGAPTRLRTGSIVVIGYWHLMPLFDRMLAEPGWRPAVALEGPPESPVRSLRAVGRGGVVGSAGSIRRRQARTRLADLGRVLADRPPFPGLGPLAGAYVHDRLAAFVAERAADELARAAMWRRVLSQGRIAQVIVPNDVVPNVRLLVMLAVDAGIPVLAVQHGVYLPPPADGADPIDDRVGDLELSPEVALWSPLSAAAVTGRRGGTHVVGYPVPHSIDRGRELAPTAREPHVVVLVQGPERVSALVDTRMTTHHSATAVRAVRHRWPDARVTLRPHPAYGDSAMRAVQAAFPDIRIDVERSMPIAELARASDVCVGAKSTATFEAALAGVPVLPLNLTGAEWKWPLGGDTPVPVAHSEEELSDRLQRVAGYSGEPPGRSELLHALGANGADGTQRLLELIRNRAT